MLQLIDQKMLVSGLQGERKGRGVDLALLRESMLVGGEGAVKLVPKRLAKAKGFFLIGGDFVRLTSGDWLTKKKKKKAGGADAVLLGDMILVIAGIVAIFVLVVEVVVHVAVAVV